MDPDKIEHQVIFEYHGTMVPSDVRQFVAKNIDVGLSLSGTSDVRTLRGLQHFYAKKFLDTKSQIAYQAVLSYATSAEAACSGSGLEFLRMLCGHEKKPITTIRDVKKMLIDMGLSQHNTALVMQAYMLAGKHSKMAIKKAAGGVPIVELLNGYNFNNPSQSHVNLKNPRILCIDGYVESVSEIHHLLEHLAQTRENCVLFLRGLADDVLHTLRVNVNRGTLYVYPVIIPFDLDNANTLVDIATIAGGDVISHLKGDLISSVEPAGLQKVDSISLSTSGFIINNSKTSSRVVGHRKRLLEDSLRRTEISEILEKRIKSLTPSYVEISLVDGIDYLSNKSQVDEGIRRMADMLAGKDPAAIASRFYEAYMSSAENTVIV